MLNLNVFFHCIDNLKPPFNNCVCVLQLNELSERNMECVEMLHESQEEIKELRSKNTPTTGMRRHISYGLYPMVRETLRSLCSSTDTHIQITEC